MRARPWGMAFATSLALAVAAQAAVRWGPTGAAVRADIGARLLRAGDAPAAVDVLDAIPARYRGPARRYHLGTALLESGRLEDAAEELTLSLVDDAPPDLRQRALHNLALTRYRLAEGAPPGASAAAAMASVAAGREALRMDPRADDTRRNLVLAQRVLARVRPRAPGAPSDGGLRLGSPDDAHPGASHQAMTLGPLSPEEAARILDALRSAEGISVDRELTRTLGRTPPDSTFRGPPW